MSIAPAWTAPLPDFVAGGATAGVVSTPAPIPPAGTSLRSAARPIRPASSRAARSRAMSASPANAGVAPETAGAETVTQ